MWEQISQTPNAKEYVVLAVPALSAIKHATGYLRIRSYFSQCYWSAYRNFARSTSERVQVAM